MPPILSQKSFSFSIQKLQISSNPKYLYVNKTEMFSTSTNLQPSSPKKFHPFSFRTFEILSLCMNVFIGDFPYTVWQASIHFYHKKPYDPHLVAWNAKDAFQSLCLAMSTIDQMAFHCGIRWFSYRLIQILLERFRMSWCDYTLVFITGTWSVQCPLQSVVPTSP